MAALGRTATEAASIFPTYRGGEHSAGNIRNRLLAERVERPNARREGAGKMLLRQRVDDALIRQLMRFSDEPEKRTSGRTAASQRFESYNAHHA